MKGRWLAQVQARTTAGPHTATKLHDEQEAAARWWDEEMAKLYRRGVLELPPRLNFPEEHPGIPLPAPLPPSKRRKLQHQ